MSISIATTESPASSLPSTPTSTRSVESNFSFDLEPTVRSTSGKTAKIAGAIFLGALAIVGAALLIAGTVASFGVLPFALTIAATIISGISCIRLAISAGSKEDVAIDEDIPYVLPNPASSFDEKNVVDLCALIEEENHVLQSYEKTDIHPNFARDCVRDRELILVEGKSLAEHFPLESERIKTLKEAKSNLESMDSDDGQMDRVSSELEVAKEDLQTKILTKLTQVISKNLGEKSPLTAAVTGAISQNMGSLLNSRMQLLAQKEYGGALLRGFKDPLISNQFSLEFTNSVSTAVTVKIESKGEFGLLSQEGAAPKKLAMPCLYQGTSTIQIAKTGSTRILSQVDLIPG